MLSNLLIEITSNADTYPLYDGGTQVVLLVHRKLHHDGYYTAQTKNNQTQSDKKYRFSQTLLLTNASRQGFEVSC